MGYGNDKGVIPRICESLFYFVERQASPDNYKVHVLLSYLDTPPPPLGLMYGSVCVILGGCLLLGSLQ